MAQASIKHAADVVVVGGGPAGSAASSWHPASAGVAAAACTKAGFPREKVCGDALDDAALRVLGNLTDGRDGDAVDRALTVLLRLTPAT